MGIFKKQHQGGFADVIRCDSTDYLIWKWHPDKYEEGSLKRETAIRTTSILRVKPGEVAVFFYKGEKELVDFIPGPYDGKITTKNFPVLSSIIGMWYEGDTPFQAEVFFINLSKSIQIKFGIPYFDVIDPRFTDYVVPVSARGTMTFNIEDYKGFVSNHQLRTFDLEQLKEKIYSSVKHDVKEVIINAPTEHNISVMTIEGKIGLINEKVEPIIVEKVKELFNVNVVSFDINTIEIDKESTNYKELAKVTKGITARKIEAETVDFEERLRIKREEEQYAQHLSTEQANLGAFQTEKQAEVGVASAEAIGKMGENGAGSIDLGGGEKHHSEFNPMTIMAGLAVGGALAKNLSNTVNQSMNLSTGEIPPVPKVIYYLAVDNQPTGPFEKEGIIEMIANNKINKDSLIWKSGTPTWEKADSFKEFESLFPPEINNK